MQKTFCLCCSRVKIQKKLCQLMGNTWFPRKLVLGLLEVRFLRTAAQQGWKAVLQWTSEKFAGDTVKGTPGNGWAWKRWGKDTFYTDL